MSASTASARILWLAAVLAVVGSPPNVATAQARPPKIALEDLPTTSTKGLPIEILRLVARDYEKEEQSLSCADLRRCDELDLRGRSVDLDGDGTAEWLVIDQGQSGTGAELDYIFRKGRDGRWKMIGRVEGLHLMTVGPKKTRGFLDINGTVAGVCVEGPGRAVWNGSRYVVRKGRLKNKPC